MLESLRSGEGGRPGLGRRQLLTQPDPRCRDGAVPANPIGAGCFYTNEPVNLLKIRRFYFWNRADPVN